MKRTITIFLLAASLAFAGKQAIPTKHKGHRMPGAVKIATYPILHGPGGQITKAVARLLW